jgi:LemA protein
MDERESKIIEEYVSKMLEVQKEQFEKPLTLNELKEIAYSVGMSESEWQASQQVMEQHLRTGKGHVRNKNWLDAVTELKQAVAINPYHEDALYNLALSYHELYRKSGTELYKKEAKSAADRVLKNQDSKMDAASIALLNEIRNTETDHKNKRNRVLMIIGGVIIGFFLIFLLLFWGASASVGSRANELEQLQVKVEQNWAQVENVYQRRETLIPQIVNLAKSASKYDAAKLNELQRKRRELNPSNRDDYRQKQEEITKALTELMANMEGNAQTMRDIQIQVEGSENRIRVEWKKYNDVVAEYNTSVVNYNDAIGSFPASMLGYKAKEKIKVEIKK